MQVCHDNDRTFQVKSFFRMLRLNKRGFLYNFFHLIYRKWLKKFLNLEETSYSHQIKFNLFLYHEKEANTLHRLFLLHPLIQKH
jgi:hypothetical protein